MPRAATLTLAVVILSTSAGLALAQTDLQQSLDGSALSAVSPQELMPPGKRHESEVPDTLDLAERARIAVEGLTNFLDARSDYGEFGHGMICTNPPCMVKDAGQSQNWGKVVDGLILARQMSGSDVNLDVELKTLRGMMDYAVLKMNEPYPVPLARITMAMITLNQQMPRPELTEAINQYKDAMVAKIKVDEKGNYGYFGPPENRFERDNSFPDMGDFGYSLPVFTSGTVLRALVMADELPDVEVDPKSLELLRNYIMQSEFWTPESHPTMVVPADNAQFTGHIHSYTQGLLGLFYYARHTGDAQTMEFVRRGYEYMRTYGLARIGLFGEGCAVGDMTYLAVELSKAGVGDYWEDVDQYTRNHLVELQFLDTESAQSVVSEHGPPLSSITLGSWAQNPDSKDVINRCRGIFFSDASHPTLIPLRKEHVPDRSCMQWVVCCTGNCTKGMYEAWNSIVEFDSVTRTAKINLLLNRASPWVDVASYLPNEGRVFITNKNAGSLLVRMPAWVDKSQVRCVTNGKSTPIGWIGNYATVLDVGRTDKVEFAFPVVESIERHRLAWQEDQFWQEGNRPPKFWPQRPPKDFIIHFRGNTLVDIEPRDTSVGLPLYDDRGENTLRVPPATRNVARFVYEPEL